MTQTLQRKGSLLLIAGLDVEKPAEYLSSQASPDNQNFYLDRSVLTKRSGTTQLGAVIGGTGVEIMGGRELIREGSRYNVRVGLDKIEKWNSGTSSWDDITGSDLTGDTDDLVDIAAPLLSGKRILCITNGKDNIRKWTASGNTADLGGTPPVAKFIHEYKTYLVCANIQGGTDIAARVQWSDTADPETWDSGNAGSVDLVEDGEDITGLNIFQDFICVHKKSCIYLGGLVSSNSIFRFERRATEVGTICNNTIVNLPTGEQIFLASDGLRLFNGVSAPGIDSPINDEIRDGINQNYAHKSWAVLVQEKDEVWVGIPIGDETSGDTVYKFNYKTRVLYRDTRSGISAVWRASQTSDLTWDQMTGSYDDYTGRWDDTNLTESFQLIMLSDTSGFTYKDDSTVRNDDGVAVDAWWESKDYEADEKGRLARWMEMALYAKGSSVTIEYSTDSGTTWTEVSQSPLTLSDDFPSDDDPDIIYFDIISTKIRFRFRNNNAGESLAIKQFILGYKNRERRY